MEQGGGGAAREWRDPGEIGIRAERYRRRYGARIALNPMALAGNWTVLATEVTDDEHCKATGNRGYSRSAGSNGSGNGSGRGRSSHTYTGLHFPDADEWREWARQERAAGRGARSSIRDNLKGHLSYDLVRWLLQHGILPLYTALSGSWLNMAESLQRILVRRALAGQHPERAEQLIDWLDQMVVGWNRLPTPFVWNGPRRRRRERACLRRLGGSGAAVHHGYSIAM